jgi:hypothetical protein
VKDYGIEIFSPDTVQNLMIFLPVYRNYLHKRCKKHLGGKPNEWDNENKESGELKTSCRKVYEESVLPKYDELMKKLGYLVVEQQNGNKMELSGRDEEFKEIMGMMMNLYKSLFSDQFEHLHFNDTKLSRSRHNFYLKMVQLEMKHSSKDDWEYFLNTREGVPNTLKSYLDAVRAMIDMPVNRQNRSPIGRFIQSIDNLSPKLNGDGSNKFQKMIGRNMEMIKELYEDYLKQSSKENYIQLIVQIGRLKELLILYLKEIDRNQSANGLYNDILGGVDTTLSFLALRQSEIKNGSRPAAEVVTESKPGLWSRIFGKQWKP